MIAHSDNWDAHRQSKVSALAPRRLRPLHEASDGMRPGASNLPNPLRTAMPNNGLGSELGLTVRSAHAPIITREEKG